MKWHPLSLIIHPAIEPHKAENEEAAGAAEREVMQQAYDIIASRLEAVSEPTPEGTYDPND